jgi:hypothetical protein
VAVDDYRVGLGEPCNRRFLEVPKPKANGAGDAQLLVLMGREHVHDWRPPPRQSLDMFPIDRPGQGFYATVRDVLAAR